jgi:hypothetical protein
MAKSPQDAAAQAQAQQAQAQQQAQQAQQTQQAQQAQAGQQGQQQQQDPQALALAAQVGQEAQRAGVDPGLVRPPPADDLAGVAGCPAGRRGGWRHHAGRGARQPSSGRLLIHPWGRVGSSGPGHPELSPPPFSSSTSVSKGQPVAEIPTMSVTVVADEATALLNLLSAKLDLLLIRQAM